jgi:REP element-mobilizing transposase RayT
MWNDTDIPLAVLFTFRCYGTWLHGDERGSVDRNHNTYGTPRIQPNPAWHKFNEELLSDPPFILNAASRTAVYQAIAETCAKRGWYEHATSVRTSHAHTVIDIGAKDSRGALAAIKANATRRLREEGLWTHDHSPWADKGSCRNLWNERSVWEAGNYVKNGQGGELPDFDWW